MRKRNQVGETLGAEMSDELADFYYDDSYGKKRENEFVGRNNRWRQHAAKAKFPAFDLFIDVTPDKKLKLELKSERRSTKETPNFFVELISNDKTQEPGGPFKPGLEATYYVHWFSDGEIFCFFTTDFRKVVEDFLATDEGKRATRHRKYNRGYTTVGVCIPRAYFDKIRLLDIVVPSSKVHAQSPLKEANLWVTQGKYIELILKDWFSK